MDAAENARKQSIARHREPDARLTELKHEQRRDHAHESADKNNEADAGEMHFLEGVYNGSSIVHERVPADKAGEDDDYADVEDRTHDKRGDDAYGHVAL